MRNTLGLVGIEADPVARTATVSMARQWDVQDIPRMAAELASMYARNGWGATFMEASTGEYMIKALRRAGMPVRVVISQKKVSDLGMIERLVRMELIEATEFLRKLKLNGQVRFPRRPSDHMARLEAQMPFFSKHVTEAGSVSYFAPGEEPDDLVRALIIACFSCRAELEGTTGGTFVGGIPKAAVPMVPVFTRYSKADLEAFDSLADI